MKNKIQNILKIIEEKHNVEIFYACESGSRAWGFSSQNSDWDVRFIYKKKLEKYLTVFNEDNLVLDCNNSEIIKTFKKHNIDIVGWDIKKTLFRLSKHSIDVISWLTTNQYENIYYESEKSKYLFRLALELFCPKTAYHSYLGLATRTFDDIRNENNPKIKKYMYLLRSILGCIWLEYYCTVPPLHIDAIYDDYQIQPELKKNGVLGDIRQIVELKKLETEQDRCERNSNLDNFYLEKKKYYTKLAKDLAPFIKTSKDLVQLQEEMDSHFFDFLLE